MAAARPAALHHSLAWVSAGNLISKLLMFAATIIVANRVREAGFGALSVGFTIVNYISVFAFAGIDTVTTREAAAAPAARLAEFTGQVVWLRAGVVGLGLALAWAAGSVLGGAAGWLTRLYAVSFVPQIIYPVNLFYGVEWSWPVTVYFVGGRVVYLGLIVLGVRGEADAQWVPLAFGAAIAVENTYLFVLWVRRYGCRLRGMWERLNWWRWRAALPVTLAMAGVLLHENAALLVVYLARGAAEAGVYSAAYRLVYVAISLTQLCSYVYLARFTRMSAEGGGAAGLYGRMQGAALVLGGAMAVCGMAAAGPVVRLLYRAEYGASAGVLAWGIWQMALAPARVMAFQTLTALRVHGTLLRAIAAGVSASVVLVVAGTLWRGAAGAALGTVLGEAAVAALLGAAAFRVLSKNANK